MRTRDDQGDKPYGWLRRMQDGQLRVVPDPLDTELVDDEGPQAAPLGTRRCRHCEQPVGWRALRNGKQRPFDLKLLGADQLDEPARYVPTRMGGQVVMIPAADMAPRRLEGVRWFAALHICVQGLQAWKERHDPQGMGDIAQELLERLTGTYAAEAGE